jgi:hypothetical protein
VVTGRTEEAQAEALIDRQKTNQKPARVILFRGVLIMALSQHAHEFCKGKPFPTRNAIFSEGQTHLNWQFFSY